MIKAKDKIIERIFKSANNVTVTVPVKKEELLHIDSKSVLNSVTRLLRDARNISDPIEETIEKNDNSKSPTLQYVSKNIWNLSASPSSEISCDDSVILEICDTP